MSTSAVPFRVCGNDYNHSSFPYYGDVVDKDFDGGCIVSISKPYEVIVCTSKGWIEWGVSKNAAPFTFVIPQSSVFWGESPEATEEGLVLRCPRGNKDTDPNWLRRIEDLFVDTCIHDSLFICKGMQRKIVGEYLSNTGVKRKLPYEFVPSSDWLWYNQSPFTTSEGKVIEGHKISFYNREGNKLSIRRNEAVASSSLEGLLSLSSLSS